MATKRQVSTSSVVELFQRVLKFKRNAFVNPSQRVYTPGAHQLGVPADLLRHPYVVIDGESQPSPDEIDMLYQQYPIHHVLVTDEKQTAVYHGGVGRVYTPRQLRQAFGYREVDDSTRGDLLESWMRRPLALCSDHDYMLLTLHSVYALLVEFGFTRSQALRCVGRILLGFAVGTPLTAELWLQPELLGRTLSARAASILQDTCAVALDASTWLRLIYLMAPVDWSQMRWDLLGPLYTQTLSRADRRSAGIFYTPPELVDQVLDTAGVVERLPVTGEYIIVTAVVYKATQCVLRRLSGYLPVRRYTSLQIEPKKHAVTCIHTLRHKQRLHEFLSYNLLVVPLSFLQEKLPVLHPVSRCDAAAVGYMRITGCIESPALVLQTNWFEDPLLQIL
jgi:hypothetical protein